MGRGKAQTGAVKGSSGAPAVNNGGGKGDGGPARSLRALRGHGPGQSARRSDSVTVARVSRAGRVVHPAKQGGGEGLRRALLARVWRQEGECAPASERPGSGS